MHHVASLREALERTAVKFPYLSNSICNMSSGQR
jgi:hypothetical protein